MHYNNSGTLDNTLRERGNREGNGGGWGIGKGKLIFFLLKSVKCQEGPLGQRKVSQLICRQLKGEVEVIFFSCPCFYLNYHFILNHVIIILDSVISR